MKYVDVRGLTRAPLPLHLTPWFYRVVLGYPIWRMRGKDGWEYLADEDYKLLFGRWPAPFGPRGRFL